METPSLVRKEHARALLHDAILSAARSTFADRGYDGATIDEIAARADVGKGTVYNYVEGGKAGLFLSILDEHFDDLHALALAALADDGTTLRARIGRYIADFARYFDQHRDFFVLHLREVPRLILEAGSDTAERIKGRRTQMIETLVPPIDAAIAAGEIRPVPAQLTAHLCFSLLLGSLFQPCEGEPEALPVSMPDPDTLALELTALVFDGIDARPSR